MCACTCHILCSSHFVTVIEIQLSDIISTLDISYLFQNIQEILGKVLGTNSQSK